MDNLQLSVLRWENQQWSTIPKDPITVEAPLDIQLISGRGEHRDCKNLVMTMRTPGHDPALAVGFLFAEGIIGGLEDVEDISCISTDLIRITLATNIKPLEVNTARYSPVTASCGVCGKTSIKQLAMAVPPAYFPANGQPQLAPTVICSLPERLRSAQALFSQTGSIHAAALFDEAGILLHLYEDVGRHNALDKLLGHTLLNSSSPIGHYWPWRKKVLLLSGRVSYELVQKAAMAGTPIIAAIGAPSSAAIELAKATGITLVGFVKKNRLNVYTYSERLRAVTAASTT